LQPYPLGLSGHSLPTIFAASPDDTTWALTFAASDTGRALTGDHRDAAWYGAEARRLAGEGRFPEAMQADFVRLTLELDRRRLARFHPSRTPHEYVMDPALSPEARRNLHQLVQALYRYVFARVPCDAAAYDAWHRQALADRYAPAN